jgi:excinuclease ABC subunit C
MPDIIFVDGGLGHVHAVQEVLSAMRLHIIVAGMVKDDRHRTRGLIVDGQEIDLKERPVLFRYVTTIQDEVHRFAIDYHHGIRNRSMQKSVLDNAPGIGEKRKKSLLSRFGSIENIRKATVEELAETEGMTVRAAESLMEYLKNMQ